MSGYRQVIVIVPRASLQRIDPRVISSSPGVQLRACPDYADDYLGQQVTKLHADRFTDAETILHLDSDQVFIAPCALPDRLFHDGCPRIAFDLRGRRPVTDGWRRCPAEFLREPIPVDLTTPLPLALPRHVYGALRKVCQRLHRRSIADYVLAGRADRFCELALLRAYALTRESERYAWFDAARHELLPECRTFWSRAQTPAAMASCLPPALTTAVAGW